MDRLCGLALSPLSQAQCQSESLGFLKRANPERLQQVFNKYASVTRDGQRYMTPTDFIRNFIGWFGERNYNPVSVRLLGGIIDTSKDGLISFPEFQAFEAQLCVPDALYRTAFQLFDTNGSGTVSFDEFRGIITNTTLHQHIPFDLESDFIKLYFGEKRNRNVTYREFSQFLHDFHEEHAVQAFKRFDRHGTGFISALDFNNIMVNIKSHLLTEPVRANLVAIAEGQLVSFPFFVAFNKLLNNMELIKRVYLYSTNGNRNAEVSKDEFLQSAQMMSQITPFEVDLLYKMSALIHTSSQLLYSDLQAIAPEQYMKQVTKQYAHIKAVESPDDRSMVIELLESAYRFGLGAIAGSLGATAVYPIDLVKTRMQNQRSGSFIGELMYKNSMDCFKKVVRFEGVTGLYRGLLPQLVGVAPEKAIKLTVNDLVRDKLAGHQGVVPLWGEILAGACAGGSQVVFTNPLEIVKIRLQVAGEIAGSRVGALSVIKDLGFLGLYKGSRACFLRDIPFSAIYFPVYAHSKQLLADEQGYNAPYTLLVAGAIGGVPAASLTTPADVIKTRLQVAARSGQTTYTGVFDAARKILREEGFSAFWKGAPARVLRSSPQFGVTLLSYELLQRFFYVDFGGLRPTGSVTSAPTSLSETVRSENRDHVGGYRLAVPILDGLETKFGLAFPRFATPAVTPAPASSSAAGVVLASPLTA